MTPKKVFIILMSINLLNYIDRQILFSVFPLIKADLLLSDTQLGLLASAFMLVYMVIAPLVGYFGDRTPRQIWIAISAFLWSIATMFTGTVKNYFQLLTARSLIGVGESGFTSVSPSFVAERFPASSRARVLAFFSLALPIGSALGYLLGAWMGDLIGWRAAFFIVGLPGIILAFIVFLKVKDTRPAKLAPQEKPDIKQYAALLKNKTFLYVCLGQAMGTFTLGGLAAWMPSYFNRCFGLSVGAAGTLFGAMIITAGAAGTFLGGIIADKLIKRTQKAYFITSYVSFLAALPFAVAALFAGSKTAAIILLSLAIMLVFLQNGPMQAAIVASTDIKVRSMAFALNIFIIHALGDAISPAFIGKVSDMFDIRIGILFSLVFVIPAGLFAMAASKYYKPENIS